MPEQKHEEISMVLKNGMKISLGRPGFGGETIRGEPLDFTVTHPDGGVARIKVTCVSRPDGNNSVELVAELGKPLEIGDVSCSGGASFQPKNLKEIRFSSSSSTPDCITHGVFHEIKLALWPKKSDK